MAFGQWFAARKRLVAGSRAVNPGWQPFASGLDIRRFWLPGLAHRHGRKLDSSDISADRSQ